MCVRVCVCVWVGGWVCVDGVVIEGARWDNYAHILADSRPKELYTDCPKVSCFYQAEQ